MKMAEGKWSLELRVVRKELCTPPLLPHVRRLSTASVLGDAQSSVNQRGSTF